jgi:hypothetical protein
VLLQVQSGGSFDVDYSVTGPNEKVILDGTKERQGDFVFTANEPGEYRFCFNNEMSTFAEKMVDFEIAVSVLPPTGVDEVHYTAYVAQREQLVLMFAPTGRKRVSRRAPLQARLFPRTDVRPRRIPSQALRSALNYFPQPEILPYARESQF